MCFSINRVVKLILKLSQEDLTMMIVSQPPSQFVPCMG